MTCAIQTAVGGAPIPGVVGSYQLFSSLDADLKAASVGDIALLFGGGASSDLVGIWQKYATSPDRVRVVTPLVLSNVNASSPCIVIGTDTTAVWGSDPSWADGGLKLAKNSHVVIDCAGQWGGTYWNSTWRGQAKQSGADATGAYFGGGWASGSQSRGMSGVIVSDASLWYRRVADGETAINAIMNLAGAITNTRRERTVLATYLTYHLVGLLFQNSPYGSVTHQALLSTWSGSTPYEQLVGESGNGLGAAYVQQDNADQQLMAVSASSAGTLDWVVTEVEVSRLRAA